MGDTDAFFTCLSLLTANIRPSSAFRFPSQVETLLKVRESLYVL